MGGRDRDGRMHAPYVLLYLLVRPVWSDSCQLVETWSEVVGLYAPRLRRPRRGGRVCNVLSHSKPRVRIVVRHLQLGPGQSFDWKAPKYVSLICLIRAQISKSFTLKWAPIPVCFTD